MDLRDRLDAAGYTVDGVIELIGDLGQGALGRNATVVARRALDRARQYAGQDTPLATLTRLFILQDPVPLADAERALGPLADVADVIETEGEKARAKVDVRPYASPDDGATGYLVSDLTPGLDGAPTDPGEDYVLGANPASRQLAELTVRRPVASALDLGTGCGVQSLHLARHADRVVATDLNERALQLARRSFQLNRLEVDARQGDLYAPVADENFDLIVTNPPYVLTPPSAARLTYREQAVSPDGPADAFVRRVVREGVARLTPPAGPGRPGGLLQVLGNWAVTGTSDLPDASWTGDVACDLFVVERERLDVAEYVEMWLADAGHLGRPGWRERYEAWLDWFDDRGVLAVGMGWINARRTADEPHVRAERWGWPIAGAAGIAVAEHFDAVDRLRATAAAAPGMSPDEALLARAWTVAPDVDVETVADPGAEDPRTIVYRSRSGLRRAVTADTWLAAVLGAADGDLPLGALAGAVDQLLETPPLREDPGRLARLRECVELGLLR